MIAPRPSSQRWAASHLKAAEPTKEESRIEVDRPTRFALYERLYFFELERREKIQARLPLAFAVIAAIASLWASLLKAAAAKALTLQFAAYFWPALALSFVSLAVAAWHFRKAWYGHSDKHLPVAQEIEEYHDKVTKTYAGRDDRDELVSGAFGDFLFNQYMSCSSANAASNDSRSLHFYRTLVSVTVALLLTAAASILLSLGSSDEQVRSTSATAPARSSTGP